MKYFVYRLIAPRPAFRLDMTDMERRVRQDHSAFWKGLLDKGIVIIFGPVLDSKGDWGIAIFEAEDLPQAEDICKNDPAILANVGFAREILPMAQAIVRNSKNPLS